MGTDTCGSIRIPSAYQALVGLRGTSGLSSTKGVMPLSSTQDVAGPLARSVEDLAIMLDATVPDRVNGTKRISYRKALTADGLKGAHIGVLRALFGTAPEDKEGQEVADRAMAAMRAAGATLDDVEIPGLDDLLKDSSLALYEFKYDLAAYLAAQPHAPVTSLGEIIARGLHHDALDTRFRERDAPKARDEAGYAKVLDKRARLRAIVLKVMADKGLDALVYPTTLRRPPLIGSDDSGAAPNCQFSATTGLPAIAIPAGFSARDLPIGLELLGGAFAEPTLLRLAYGWEQTAHPRQPPFSTPPLVDGRGPAPRVFTATIAGTARVRFSYDPMTSVLGASAQLDGVPADDMIALALHRSHDGGPGPVVALLLTAGHIAGNQQITLPARDRADLLAGRLYVSLYTRAAPLGMGRTAIVPISPTGSAPGSP
jgi:Asp-tRNA(Asn)/Glu-tRNA(Gln) amidotransferase A subunit family amidase